MYCTFQTNAGIVRSQELIRVQITLQTIGGPSEYKLAASSHPFFQIIWRVWNLTDPDAASNNKQSKQFRYHFVACNK